MGKREVSSQYINTTKDEDTHFHSDYSAQMSRSSHYFTQDFNVNSPSNSGIGCMDLHGSEGNGFDFGRPTTSSHHDHDDLDHDIVNHGGEECLPSLWHKEARLAKRIDKTCRILFPILFIIFNLIYWLYYLVYN